jgi:hypothetical protein
MLSTTLRKSLTTAGRLTGAAKYAEPAAVETVEEEDEGTAAGAGDED